MKRILPLLVTSLLLGGCGIFGTPDKAPGSAESMYKDAKEELANGNYNRATRLFEALTARYPYGRFAQQAELEIAYANYKDGETVLALAAIDRFIKQHPTHPSVDYAYYLKGLINFVQDKTLFANIAQQDMSERDPKSARESFAAFKELITRFPQSRYTEDARDRLAYLVSNLADGELHVARYYYQRGAFLAAANRAKAIVDTYPTSNRVETALVLMSAAYDKLGQTELRDDTQRVLRKNFPDTRVTTEIALAEKAWWKLW